MDNEIKTWLYDMLQSTIEIESYFENKEKRYDDFIKDRKLKRAVERNIEIIGEAINRILKKDSNFNITNARKIVDTRNRIIHGYDTVTDDFLWSIIINHIPQLRVELEEFFK
ncbi:MAG: DUF86 domain-containing protein [Bacteroidetes bacterium]|nr:DUF86 domain-containing protein [Bacteroidota bacterium]